MPTYEFKCQDDSCLHEWEDFLSIKAPDPEACPKCHAQKVLRLISGGSGKGVVELYGQDLLDKCKSDAQKIKKEAAQDANKYANLLGENKYNDIQTRLDRRSR